MGKIFKRALDVIKANKERREKGIVNCLPFSLERFEEYVPGIEQKNYVIVTASSGVGKSKFTKKLFVLEPYSFLRQHPEMDIKLDIFYFCLEESVTNFVHSLISNKLYEDHGIRVPIKDLKSIHRERILPDKILKLIEETEHYFDGLEEHLHISDDIRNPYGIFKTVEDFMLDNGEWITKKKEIRGKMMEIRDYYKPHHQNHYVVVIVDHVSLLHAEKGMSGLHEAISKLSSDYLLTLRDKYGCSPVIVQQQSADKEKQQFTYKGQSIESKLEPSLDGLADNKLTQRDADEVFGIFAPDRYEIENHRGYNVRLLKDNYRSLMVLKYRDGTPNARIGVFFDGATNNIEELPKKEQMNDEMYQYYLEKVGRNNNSSNQMINFS